MDVKIILPKRASKTFEGIANAMAEQWGKVGNFTQNSRSSGFATQNSINKDYMSVH